MSEYKYEYFQFAGDPDIKINTDWGYDFSDIKNKVISQTSDLIVREAEYPNGFKVLIEQAANSTVFKTNKPLIKNADGSFNVDLNA